MSALRYGKGNPPKASLWATLALLGACIAGCASVRAPDAGHARVLMAPSGTLRVAINVGNPILAQTQQAPLEPTGVSVDLARELGRQLGVPVTLVQYPAAGKVVEGLQSNQWDVAFVALDPVRANVMEQSVPYLEIKGAYLVPDRSAIHDNAEVDRAGVTVVVGAGSAYDLFLTRELQHATLERAPTSPSVVSTFLDGHYAVAAGVRQQLEADAKRVGGLRMLPGYFMLIDQAMATPPGRPGAIAYLNAFLEQMKQSGFIAASLARHEVSGVVLLPPSASDEQ